MGHAPIALTLFGAFDIQVGGSPASLGLTGATRSLLQFLVCSGGKLTRREQLTDMFWGDTSPERRRSSLNSAIWRIKKALRAVGAPTVLSLDASVDCVRMAGLNAPEVEVDIFVLSDALSAASAPDVADSGIERLTAILARCEGTPLDGLDDDWALVERERLSALRTRGLNVALRHLAVRRRYDEALEVGNRILRHDPFHENALRELLCIHALNGQRARALQLYTTFTASLEAELGIAPMAETRALRDYLVRDDGGVIVPIPAPSGFGALVAGHPCMDELVSAIERTRAFAAQA